MKPLDLEFSSQFRRDLKRAKKRRYDLTLLGDVVHALRQQVPLAEKYRDHALTGDYRGYRECHILPDWLLVYRVEQEKLILVLSRTGTHSDLFQ